MDLAVLWFGIVAFFFVGYFVLEGAFAVGYAVMGRDVSRCTSSAIARKRCSTSRRKR